MYLMVNPLILWVSGQFPVNTKLSHSLIRGTHRMYRLTVSAVRVV